MRIVYPGTQDYPTARRISNARIDYKPRLICYCENEEDVVTALRMARDKKYAVRVRAGGHQHEGMCSGDGVLIVDVSSLNRIDFDGSAETIRLGPGAKLADVYDAVFSRGLLFPGGACGDVRVGGLVQGGGWGLFARALGLTCDWLHRFRMVTRCVKGTNEDFEPIEVAGASSDPNVDLYWAVCGGGGGNFGVATELVFKLVPFRYTPSEGPKVVTQFSATWTDRGCMSDVVGEWMAGFPKDDEFRLTTFCRLIARGTEATDKPTLVSGNFIGEQAELEKILEHLLPRTLRYADQPIKYERLAIWPPTASPGPPIFTHPQYQAGPPQPGDDLATTCKGAFFRHKVSSAYPRAEVLPDAAVNTVMKHINDAPSLGNARRYLSLHSLGGVVKGDGSRDQWSCFAYRDKRFLMQVQAWWADPSLDDACLPWVANFRDEMRGYTEGSFINFPDRDLIDTTDRNTLMRPYYGKNFDKLKRIKHTYDPNDFFGFEMGIPAK